MTHKGFVNYPTWAVAYDINNVESVYLLIRTIVRLSKDVYEAADNIEGFWTTKIGLLNLAGIADDLMDYALSCVDWLEIAKSIAADVYEESALTSHSDLDIDRQNALLDEVDDG